MSRSDALQLVAELRNGGRISTVEAEVLRGTLEARYADGPGGVSPGDFRRSLGLSLARMAVKAGVTGRNPARTWQRWEEGERKPPYEIIAVVERLSSGRVTFASWSDLRPAHPAARYAAPVIHAFEASQARPRPDIANEGLRVVAERLGSCRALALGLGISPQAVGQWDEIPPLRVLEVERLTGVPRHILRPDMYPAPIKGAEPHSLRTVADLFDRFEGSANVGRAIGKSTEHANSMRERRSIPLRYWPALIAAARKIGLDLDEATLVRLHLAAPARETAP